MGAGGLQLLLSILKPVQFRVKHAQTELAAQQIAAVIVLRGRIRCAAGWGRFRRKSGQVFNRLSMESLGLGVVSHHLQDLAQPAIRPAHHPAQ